MAEIEARNLHSKLYMKSKQCVIWYIYHLIRYFDPIFKWSSFKELLGLSISNFDSVLGYNA